jgi:arylsulfatase A-like enzyme
MNRRAFLRQMGLGATALGLGASVGAAESSKRPNIIVIMCDDMGYSDIGCYGGEVETPNLDQLAEKGVRFRQFYNTARCCPSRASLLTGLYAHQAGIGGMVSEKTQKGYEGYLTDRCVTVAEVLRDGGYQTRMVGKWHVAPHDSKTNTPKRREAWPLQRGFEKFWGTIAGAGSFYAPKGLMRDNEIIEVEDPDSFYYTDAISDQASEWVRGCNAQDTPFFMYIGYTAPHWPLHALPEDIKKYEDRYNAGWDKLREERHARMKAMGVLAKDWPLSPRHPDAPAWETAEHKAWEARRMAVYAAMIDRMDQGIGRVVSTLKEEGVFDNTLILFLADNGGCAEDISPMGGSCKVAKERGEARGWKMRAGNIPNVMPGPKETFGSYDLPWANASNTPFRLFKKWGHEGGISTPLIASWPDGLRDTGGFTDEVGHIIDLMPTCLDAAGVDYPESYPGRELLPVEGKSLLPIFKTGTREGHKHLYWEHFGNRAIRQDQWKLVAERGKPWELYDLEADRTELNNLMDTHSELATTLEKEWDAWAKRAFVNIPGKNTKAKGKRK